MNQEPDPIVSARPDVDSDAVPRVPPKRKARPSLGLRKPELKQTSMIDVVFLLLIFFVVTASFQIDEGSLLATLPGTTGDHIGPPPIPVEIDLQSSDDGLTYTMRVDGVPIGGASELSAYMANRIQTGQMASDDLVKISPQGVVRWQHALNVYNACIDAELKQVTFAQAAMAR